MAASRSSADREYDIFISYCHKEQDIVKRIHRSLQSKNYKVWIDWDHMRGSVLDAMADAVENSAVILICISEGYFSSENCKKEAEYADEIGKRIIPLLLQRGYKPKGWLGVLLGKKIYHDFTDKYPYNESLSKLLKEIRVQSSSSSSLQRYSAQLGSSEMKKLRKLFDECDLNGDGSISVNELEHVAKSVGMKYTRAQIQARIAEMDENGNLITDETAFSWAATMI